MPNPVPLHVRACLQAKPDAFKLPDACAKIDAANGNKYSSDRAKAQAGRRMAETAANTTRADLVDDIISWYLETKTLGLSLANLDINNATFMVRACVTVPLTRNYACLWLAGRHCSIPCMYPVQPRIAGFRTLPMQAHKPSAANAGGVVMRQSACTASAVCPTFVHLLHLRADW